MATSNRRTLIVIGVLVVVVVVVAVLCAVLLTRDDDDEGSGTSEPRERALGLLDETPLIDGHNDMPFQASAKYNNRLENMTFDTSEPTWHTDIPRLRKGKVSTQMWVSWVHCKTQLKDAVRLGVEQISLIHRIIKKYSKDLVLVTTADGILEAKRNNKIGSMIGVEGGHMIDSSLGTMRMLYRLGARYMTLTHSCHTPWADSCSPKTIANNGLTDFGKIVVREMNRLGMIVDISHVSHKTMRDVLDVTKAPVIFSHSSAFALCNNTRNVPDDVLMRMKSNGGVVMVNFFNIFISCNSSATLSQVADHFDHVKKIAGIDHVGIGADYDGVDKVPKGLEDVSKYPNLIEELIKRGYSGEDLKKIIGENFINTFKRVEKVRDAMKDVPPYDNYLFFENVYCRPNYFGGNSSLVYGTKHLEVTKLSIDIPR